MKHKQDKHIQRFFVAALVVVVVIAIGAAAYQVYQNRPLSAAQISDKFDCERMTADFRETDIFCGNTKFYNDPDEITADEFYAYYGCQDRLKEAAPPESMKESDPLYYETYYTCTDKTKLEAERKILIANLKSWKARNR